MAKSCAWCSTKFEVTDSDREFLQKISPTFAGEKFKIPEPTLCPDCRMQRKLVWRNESSLHRRKCDKTGKDIISIYTADIPFPVYHHEAWYGDDWNATDYGRDFDFSRTFTENYQDLLNVMPHCATSVLDNENSEYCNEAGWLKDCYLVFGADECQNCMYGRHLFLNCRGSLDILYTYDIELCYQCIDCRDCYNVQYAQRCIGCSDSMFLLDCRRCRDCFGCVNLVGKQYYWFNEQLTKEKYKKHLAEFDTGSRVAMEELQSQFALHTIKSPRRAVNGQNHEDSTGNGLFNTANCQSCFDVSDSQDMKHVWSAQESNDCQSSYATIKGSELIYDSQDIGGQNIIFCGHAVENTNIYYSNWIFSSSRIFGCFGLQHVKNAIFNKVYTQAEYEKLAAKIIQHMQETGEWGEYIPMELSPFGYNETKAFDFFPLSEPEAKMQNLKWVTPDQPTAENVIAGNELPDNITNVTDDILKQTIRCPDTQRLFRIQKTELEFYRQHQIPLPTLHPERRMQLRWQRRQPYLLWKRKCEKCKSNIQAVYAPNTPEIIYCESCYEKEVE